MQPLGIADVMGRVRRRENQHASVQQDSAGRHTQVVLTSTGGFLITIGMGLGSLRSRPGAWRVGPREPARRAAERLLRMRRGTGRDVDRHARVAVRLGRQRRSSPVQSGHLAFSSSRVLGTVLSVVKLDGCEMAGDECAGNVADGDVDGQELWMVQRRVAVAS